MSGTSTLRARACGPFPPPPRTETGPRGPGENWQSAAFRTSGFPHPRPPEEKKGGGSPQIRCPQAL